MALGAQLTKQLHTDVSVFFLRRPSHRSAPAQVQGNGYDLCQHQLRLLQLQRPQLVRWFPLIPAFYPTPGSATGPTAGWGTFPLGSWSSWEEASSQGHLGDGQHSEVPSGKTRSSMVSIYSASKPAMEEGIALSRVPPHVSLGQRSVSGILPVK